jgi:hypothetical protein
MISLPRGEQITVRRLRVGYAGLDALAARLHLSRLLAGTQLNSFGLAPSAIVCIGKLRDPRLGSLRLDHTATHTPPEWRDALQSSIGSVIRGGVHPAREVAPTDAQCVIFADWAELLACLTSDLCEGRLLAHWWWRSLFKQTPDRRAIFDALNSSAEYAPGALALLARDGKAVVLASTLSEDEARTLLSAVTRKFGLRELESALDAAFAEASGAPDAAPTIAEAQTRVPRAEPAQRLTRAPWAEFTPESEEPQLRASARCLLGVCLTIARAPAILRRAEFASRAFAWTRAALAVAASEVATSTADAQASAVEAARPTLKDHAAPPSPRAGEAREAASGARARTDGQAVESSADEIKLASEPTSISRDAAASERRAHSVSTPHDKQPAPTSDGTREALDGSSQIARTPSRVRADSVLLEPICDALELSSSALEKKDHRVASRVVAPAKTHEAHTRVLPEAFALATQIETRYGGLFFLVNLALFLDLYGDFTAPRAQGLSLAVWDFVALVGRKLVGACVESDPIWSLLARLAAREEGTEPGEGFKPADEWRVPVEWLKPFSREGDLLWSAADGRLCVSHPAGFLIVDVSLRTTDERRQLSRELRPYRKAFANLQLRRDATIKRARGRTTRARWLQRLATYARARLHLALGTRNARTLSRTLLERRARVFVTAAHVDVLMSLAELPVEVRFAGLDRDPGWLPAAARHIAFHFE